MSFTGYNLSDRVFLVMTGTISVSLRADYEAHPETYQIGNAAQSSRIVN